MSLTSFIRKPEVRAGFRAAVSKPAFRCAAPLLAPPRTKHYGLVGGAFDYLLRFYLERLNTNAKTYTWVAHLALTLIPENSRKFRLAQQCLEHAEQRHAEYLKSGVVTDDLLVSTLHLATLDVILRAGSGVIREEHLIRVDELDVQDLRELIAIVPESSFKAQHACILNPAFGWGSHLVGGADADLILDDLLIEIKTTKYLKLDRSYVDQMIGYQVLLKLGGICGYLSRDFQADDYELTQIGVYFARHGYLHKIPVGDVIDPCAFPKFAKWFVETACPSERERARYYKRFTWPACQTWLDELKRPAQKVTRSGGRKPAAKRSAPNQTTR